MKTSVLVNCLHTLRTTTILNVGSLPLCSGWSSKGSRCSSWPFHIKVFSSEHSGCAAMTKLIVTTNNYIYIYILYL